MQSFAFDTPNNRLFTGQLRSETAENSGDITLSQLSFSGTVLGHMYLTGFGHAVSIGAQAVGSTSYLRTETDVDTANGRGRGEPDETKATSKLWCYDINAGQLVDSFLTLAGKSLTCREPEGMAVYGSTDATARLYFGFASGVAGDRRANLFYRNTLV